jgi:8-oxo-dGTP pyrophosphatase MutT (NUDIX family)
VEVLLIFRRGAWDLPKGKLDPGETPEAGALREVAEEVGVGLETLRLLRPLGVTVHGYPHPKRPTYAVKTTHWFAMATDAAGFRPQAEEDIEAVAWAPWAAAGARLGFESLRRHHAALDPDALGV